MDKLHFSVAHIGINCEDAVGANETAGLLHTLFGLPVEEGQDSVYTGPLLELMKGDGRGTCGHIGIATDDIHAARAFLEAKGVRFVEESSKYGSENNLVVVYLEREIAGFAIHLLQR